MISLLCKVIFFLSEKRKKAKICILFTNVFAQKVQENKFMIQKRKKMTMQNARSSYL
jgi:hypothetical protein